MLNQFFDYYYMTDNISLEIYIQSVYKALSTYVDLDDENRSVVRKVIKNVYDTKTTNTMIDKFVELFKKQRKFISNDNNNSTIYQSGVEIKSLFGIKTVAQLAKELNPTTKYKRGYLVFDSRYRMNTTGTYDRIKFYYSLSPSSDKKCVSSVHKISNIIAMRMYRTKMPNYFVGQSTAEEYGSVNVAIEEFEGQASAESDGFPYHFNCKYENSELIPRNTYLSFDKPIKTLDTITFKLTSGSQRLTFYNDTAETKVSYSPGTISFAASTAHNIPLSASVIWVYTTGFSTSTPGHPTDATTIARLNRQRGFNVTVSSTTEFAAGDSITGSVTSTDLVLYLNPLRFISMMEFIYDPE